PITVLQILSQLPHCLDLKAPTHCPRACQSTKTSELIPKLFFMQILSPSLPTGNGAGFYVALTPVTSCHPQKCCICRQVGASVTCRARRCPRTFHYPCGSERGCIFQFFGEFKSFCWKHQPVQRTLCLICQEAVAKRPCYDTLVCPTCTRAWFHRHCIQLRAGAKRCAPPCTASAAHSAGTWSPSKKEMFRLGIKIPDRDAAWEENGAFADHYQRHSSCDSSQCLCPVGRGVAEENGPWRLLLCHSCGSCGTHQRCSNLGEDVDSWECCDCSNTGTGEGCSWGAGHKDQRAM
uniref:Uncharacterized protein n=1 Tax=Melopsittacus undulatus TaxID=13146 RepID=A0A8V5G4R5_MELUD